MKFRKTEDGTLYTSLMALKKDYPNIIFPKQLKEPFLNSIGVEEVIDTPKPPYNKAYQEVIFKGVGKTSNDKWEIKWEIQDKVSDTGVLSKMRKEKQKEINDLFNTEVNNLRGSIVAYEADTFNEQKAQALAYQKDNTCECLFLRKVADTRQIPLETLVQKILVKAQLYEDAFGGVLGKKHKYEDLLEAATTIREIEDIKVE